MKGSCSIRLIAALLLAAAVVGCNGVKANQPAPGGDTAASQHLPFSESKPVALPANTEIYVRLQESLSSATAHAGENFSAVLDEPLVFDNQMLAPQGTAVTGTVVAVRDSGRQHNAGYLRITLSSITLNGKPVALQTNSVFVGVAVYKNRNLAVMGGGSAGNALLDALAGGGKSASGKGKKEVGFENDKRLEFRLTQALNIS